jgi:hypothetical protein
MARDQVVSPRLKGPLAGALASHPMLQLKNWDPWRPVKELAAHLRTFLEVSPHVQGPDQYVKEASLPAALPRSMQPHRDKSILKSNRKSSVSSYWTAQTQAAHSGGSHAVWLLSTSMSCLQLVGHVDVPATLASISAGEESAYSEVEACLTRMEALTTLRPACSAEYAEMYRCAAPPRLADALPGQESIVPVSSCLPAYIALHNFRASPPVFNCRS